MNRTTIEWVRNADGTQGFTWNPITGCLNGCAYCYARRLANTRLRERYYGDDVVDMEWAPGIGGASPDLTDPFWPRFWPRKLAEAHQVKGWERGRTMTVARFEQKPRGIFVCNMGELFGPWLPREWTQQVMEAIGGCPQHRFYLLTKQPQELVKWSPFPPNAWVGVSAWDRRRFIEACEYLEGIEATVKYISLEPLLTWVSGVNVGAWAQRANVSWLIIGAQTKPTVPVPGEWIDDIVPAAHEAGVAVFLKNSLRYLVDDEHWKFELLQEFPKAVQR